MPRVFGLIGLGAALLMMMSLTVSAPVADAALISHVPAPPPVPPAAPTIQHPGEAPRPVVKVVRVKVTACSPHDSAADAAYYAKHGYAGETYNIAAHYGTFPRGTLIRVPGYMEKSYPGKFWEVDSAGGPIIRRSAAQGVKQIDVKFRTLHSVKQWGVRWLDVEVITPAALADFEASYAAWEAAKLSYDAAITVYDYEWSRFEAEMAAWRRSHGNIDAVPAL